MKMKPVIYIDTIFASIFNFCIRQKRENTGEQLYE